MLLRPGPLSFRRPAVASGRSMARGEVLHKAEKCSRRPGFCTACPRCSWMVDCASEACFRLPRRESRSGANPPCTRRRPQTRHPWEWNHNPDFDSNPEASRAKRLAGSGVSGCNNARARSHCRGGGKPAPTASRNAHPETRLLRAELRLGWSLLGTSWWYHVPAVSGRQTSKGED
jgi:hypothetical protein